MENLIFRDARQSNSNVNIDLFAQQVAKTYWRVSKLYEGTDSSLPAIKPELLPDVLRELGIATEELQVAVEELSRQNEALVVGQQSKEFEHQFYQSLFEFSPDAYILTDAVGTIREVNRAAAMLLGTQAHFLVKKPLISLIDPEERQTFRTELSRLNHLDRLELELRLQPRQLEPFDASVTIDAISIQEDKPPILRWLIRDITVAKRLKTESSGIRTTSTQYEYDLCQNRRVQTYCKSEVIPLSNQTIWFVVNGIVKLTTLSDCGEEMLVGLAGSSMIFGSGLTSLQTYQATALTDIQLVAISPAEVSASPQLAQALLPLMNQRLRQTEGFLSVYGQLRVEDRLHRLLLLLKQEIGQPVAEGTRLSTRLTHQELARACCSTRVTITRLISKLHQEGKIAFDAQNHLIIKN